MSDPEFVIFYQRLVDTPPLEDIKYVHSTSHSLVRFQRFFNKRNIYFANV